VRGEARGASPLTACLCAHAGRRPLLERPASATPGFDAGDPAQSVAPTNASGADRTGLMRPVDGAYLYNLRVPSAPANSLFGLGLVLCRQRQRRCVAIADPPWQGGAPPWLARASAPQKKTTVRSSTGEVTATDSA